MSDIQVILEVLGKEDMEKAARVTTTLTNKVDSLGKQLRKGNIDNKQFQQGVQQLIKKNAQAAGGYKNLQGQVQRYAGTLQRKINEELRAVSTQQQVQRAVSQSTKSMMTHGNAVDEVRNQYVRMNASTFRAQQGTKRFASVGLQQAGYQVGDFIVQVQNGQSALVAFGQQGSQLAGIFGPAGAIIGAFIAAGTALGMIVKAIKEAKNGASDLEGAMKSLGDAISSLEAAVSSHQMSLVELVDKYGVLAVQIRETQVAMAEAAAQEAFLDLQQTATLTTGVIGRLTEATENLAIAQSGAFEELPNILQTDPEPLRRAEIIVRNLAKELEITEEQAVTLGNALGDISSAKGLEGQARAASEVVDVLALIPDEVKESNRQFFDAIEKLGQVAEQGARAAREQQKLSESAPGQGWMDDAIKGVNSLYNRIVTAISGVRALKSEAGEQFGEGPPLVYDPTSGRYVESGQGGRSNLATNMGLDLGTGTLGSPGKSGSSGGGSGGGSGVDPAQEFNKAREALASLVSQYDDGVKVAQQLSKAQETVNQAIEAGVITTEQGQTAMQGYINSLDKAENPLKKIGQTLKDSLGDAFLSIVDGSKSAGDAFRDMARLVLKQAFEMLVIKPILNSIFGGGGGGGNFLTALFSANGNAFEQGSKVTAYANGGVVNAPTAFQHSGGLGVMGEAGPEAIMPLKRGKNGKLGVQSEQSSIPIDIRVSVDNNGNLQAFVDQRVGNGIQRAAPEIINASNSKMMDRRRRGGAVKATFG